MAPVDLPLSDPAQTGDEGAMSDNDLHCVGTHCDAATADVIFVHGLDGHWRDTSTLDKKRLEGCWQVDAGVRGFTRKCLLERVGAASRMASPHRQRRRRLLRTPAAVACRRSAPRYCHRQGGFSGTRPV
jgi:hypothetical protein